MQFLYESNELKFGEIFFGNFNEFVNSCISKGLLSVLYEEFCLLCNSFTQTPKCRTRQDIKSNSSDFWTVIISNTKFMPNDLKQIVPN